MFDGIFVNVTLSRSLDELPLHLIHDFVLLLAHRIVDDHIRRDKIGVGRDGQIVHLFLPDVLNVDNWIPEDLSVRDIDELIAVKRASECL